MTNTTVRTKQEDACIPTKTVGFGSITTAAAEIAGAYAEVQANADCELARLVSLAACKPLSRMVEPKHGCSMVTVQHVCRTLKIDGAVARAAASSCVSSPAWQSKPGVLNARFVQALYPCSGSCAREMFLHMGGLFGCG